jgi:alkanesulfonate monooxygenase SsuD/methylene tetrahydromethanopterin reductase-like flavin-dependent oxidoreductase (luciferase family)
MAISRNRFLLGSVVGLSEADAAGYGYFWMKPERVAVSRRQVHIRLLLSLIQAIGEQP